MERFDLNWDYTGGINEVKRAVATHGISILHDLSMLSGALLNMKRTCSLNRVPHYIER